LFSIEIATIPPPEDEFDMHNDYPFIFVVFYPPQPIDQSEISMRRWYDIDSLSIFSQDLLEAVSKLGKSLFNNLYYFIMILVRNDWSQALP